MAVYTRKDPPWFWLWLERPGQPALRERTRIPVDAPTAAQRKRQRELAEDAYRTRMGELARTAYALPGAQPARRFEDEADWYEAHVSTLKRGTAREREILAQLRLAFAGRHLTDLTLPAVREWMSARVQDVAASTVNRELDVLKHLLASAVPRYLPTSPIAGLRRLTVTTSDMRLLTRDEETRLLAAITDPRDRLLVV